MKIFEISPKMRCFGGKRWEKLWIRWNWPFWVNLSLILGEKIEKYAKMAILTQSKTLYWPNLAIVGHFQATLVWNDLEKLENSKKFARCTPLPEMKIFEISPKMRCFGGKRWEKLWIRWNWPLLSNLSLILGEKIEKYAKMAILTQSKPLYWPNLPLWVISSRIGVKQFEKSWKSQKICRCTPLPEMKIFEISPKMRCFGGKRWEKLWIRWNWPFWVNLSLILGEKIEKYAKMAILTQSKTLYWPNLPLWVISSHFGVKWFGKVGKLQKICRCTPSLEMKIFEISPKMRCFGGKRWEKLWIRWNWPLLSNLSLILGEKIEKYAKMAILAQSKPLFWPNVPLWVISRRIGVKQFEKVGKLQKIARYTPS